MIKDISINIAMLLALYLGSAFVSLELNPVNWDEFGRGLFAIVSFVVTAVYWEEVQKRKNL